MVEHGVGVDGTAEASFVIAFTEDRRRLEHLVKRTSSIGGRELRVLLLDVAGKGFGEQQAVSDRSFGYLLCDHPCHLYLFDYYFYEALKKSGLHQQPTC